MTVSLENTPNRIDYIKTHVNDPNLANNLGIAQNLHAAAVQMSEVLLNLEVSNLEKMDNAVASMREHGKLTEPVVLTYGPKMHFVESIWPYDLTLKRTITGIGKTAQTADEIEKPSGGGYSIDLPNHIYLNTYPKPEPVSDSTGRNVDDIVKQYTGNIGPEFTVLNNENNKRQVASNLQRYSRGLLLLLGEDFRSSL